MACHRASIATGIAEPLKPTTPGTERVERYYDSATLGKGKLWQSVSYNLHPVTAQAARHRTQVTAYDALGRPTNAWQEFQNSAGQFVSYPYARSYDLTSHITGQTYPSNRTVSYSYGTDGRLSSFAGTLGDGGSRTYADTMSYNAAGQMLQERFVTGTYLYHLMQYNSRHQMWDNRLGTTAGGWNRGALFTYYSVTARNSGIPGGNYSGNNGNVWMQEHYVPTDDGITSHTIFRDVYEYDDLNRIKRDTGWQKSTTNVWTTPHQQGFTYDQWGNRTIDAAQTFGMNINNTAFTASTANNRLDRPGGSTCTMTKSGMCYDAAGNLNFDSYTGAGDRNYDAENRMVQAAGGTGLNYYGYDADGRRVRRITSTGEVWQVYGFDGELLAEYPVNGAASTPQKEYGYRGGQMLVVGGCDVVRWIVADHLGTPRIEVDVTGTLASVRRHDYLPFGEELGVGMGTGSARSTTNGYATDCVRQRFTGYERDDETGLDFAQARYYASKQGRFISPDGLLESGRITQPQSWNRYSYVLNNPLRLVDPNGQEEEDTLFVRTIEREYEFTFIQTDEEGMAAYVAQVKVHETETQIVNQKGDVLDTTTKATVGATNVGLGYNNFTGDQLRTLENVTKDIIEVSRNKQSDPTIALGIAAEETRLGTSTYILPENRGKPEKLPSNNPMQLSGSSNLPVTTDRRANISGAIDVFNGFAARRGGDLDRSLQGFASSNYPNAPGIIKGYINEFRGDIGRTIKQTYQDRALSGGPKK